MPCIGNVPSIVASGSINKPSGGNISTTALFTPSVSGVFRVSVYFDGPTGGAGNSGATISWTDDSGSASILLQLANYPWALNGAGASTWSDVVIHADADPINIQLTGNLGSAAYTCYYAIEQLA